MNAKTTIRKILFIGLWVCIGAGMFTLLMAAIGKKNNGQCKDYVVKLEKVNGQYFITENDVVAIVEKNTGGYLRGRPISEFNLHELEKALEKNKWVKSAEVYFDKKDVLHISLNQNEPIARVFTTANVSFYINQEGEMLPLSKNTSARLPVFTGFPEIDKKGRADSATMRQTTMLAKFIYQDSFWNAQIAQIDITQQHNFEIVPTVGIHLVRIGNGDLLNQKFRRLLIFYQQVLSKLGFNKFKIIDVSYEGQVVVTNTGNTSKIDKELYKRNVEKLIQESNEKINEPVQTIPAVKGNYSLPNDEPNEPAPDFNEMESAESSVAPKVMIPQKAVTPNRDSHKTEPVRTKLEKPVVPTKIPEAVKKTTVPKTPKAIMPKKVVADKNNGYN